MYHVELITPPRQGGPFKWASILVKQLNTSGQFRAEHLYRYPDIMTRQFVSQADLIHTAFPYPLSPAGKPYLLTIKGDYLIENPLIAQLYRLAIKHAAAITVPSRYLKRRLALPQALVIPNAVEIKKNLYHHIRPSTDQRSLNLLTVTNFWFPQKAAGVKTLIKIINRLHNPNLTLTILGDGRYRSDLIAFAKETAKFPVKVLGWQNPENFYPQADIFLYYSYHDNMPNSVLEALAAGLPIITNDVGAIKEILVNHSGLIAGSQTEFYGHLQQLLASPSKRHTLSQLAHQTAKTTFAWPTIVKQYQQLYQSLLT